MRLDKWLSHLQFGTRKTVRQLLKAKRVTVDGGVVTDGGFALGDDMVVMVDDTLVTAQVDVTYLLHKPAGVVTATEDAHQRTVVDLIAPSDRRPGLFPVGRLDKDTTGLLLLTTDGALGHALLAPSRHVPKTYEAELRDVLTSAMVTQLAAGIAFKDFTSQPATVAGLGTTTACITIHEGKFHEVKRLFHAVGNEVMALKRVAMGGLSLPEDLAPGQYRALTAAEWAALEDAKK